MCKNKALNYPCPILHICGSARNEDKTLFKIDGTGQTKIARLKINAYFGSKRLGQNVDSFLNRVFYLNSHQNWIFWQPQWPELTCLCLLQQLVNPSERQWSCWLSTKWSDNQLTTLPDGQVDSMTFLFFLPQYLLHDMIFT